MTHKPDENIKEETKDIPQDEHDQAQDECNDKSDTENECIDTKAEDFEKILEEKERQIEDYKNRWIRTHADFDNYRKRSQKEIQEIYRYAGEQLIKDILPIVDNFERALDSVDDKESSLYQGVELIYKQFKETLEKHDVKEIEALGKPFDPNFHDAVMMVESEEFTENTVAEVLLKGYQYNTKVIRPSMVKVAK